MVFEIWRRGIYRLDWCRLSSFLGNTSCRAPSAGYIFVLLAIHEHADSTHTPMHLCTFIKIIHASESAKFHTSMYPMQHPTATTSHDMACAYVHRRRGCGGLASSVQHHPGSWGWCTSLGHVSMGLKVVCSSSLVMMLKPQSLLKSSEGLGRSTE